MTISSAAIHITRFLIFHARIIISTTISLIIMDQKCALNVCLLILHSIMATLYRRLKHYKYGSAELCAICINSKKENLSPDENF